MLHSSACGMTILKYSENFSDLYLLLYYYLQANKIAIIELYLWDRRNLFILRKMKEKRKKIWKGLEIYFCPLLSEKKKVKLFGGNHHLANWLMCLLLTLKLLDLTPASGSWLYIPINADPGRQLWRLK